MATKTLTITEDAYMLLKNRKGENDSFSDVIVKEFGKKKFSELAGLFAGKRGEELEKAIKENRKRMRESIDRRQREFFG